MQTSAVGARGWCICGFLAFPRVMLSGALDAPRCLIAIYRGMSVRLTPVTLYYWFFGLELLPIDFYIFNIPDVIYLDEGCAGSECNPVYRIACMSG